jgi:hypothetical protein
MNARTSKPRSRKTMRVATVFTGVTAGMATFAPTAHAQAVQTQPAGVHAGHVRPDSSIQANAYCYKFPHWFHIYYNDVSSSMCFGYKGTMNVAGNFLWVSAFCGGTNHGHFSGHLSSGFGKQLTDQTYGSGSQLYFFTSAAKYNHKKFSVSKVTISGWTGDKTCY